MKHLYTAIFVTDDDTVYARIPDLPGCVTTGDSLEDAIEQITDAASLWLVVAEDQGREIPVASAQADLDIPAGASCSLISVDTIAYRTATDTRAVRKNVSLPAWMVTMADKRGINCSRVLQDALRRQLR